MTTSGISPSFLGLSQSSGQVTHVLLTRSRLCPRPKPGSSLHLHVLGTPPAFVLSQDQTLREELQSERLLGRSRIHKECQGPARRSGRDPPSVVGGPGPVRWCGQALASSRGSSMYTNELRDARRGLSILAPPTERPHEGTCRATASNLDTLLDRGIGRSVRMLL